MPASSPLSTPIRRSPWRTPLIAAAALGACALAVAAMTRRAERSFPPTGRFVTVDGVKLHYKVLGSHAAAQTVVLLHGNGTMAEEIEISGLAEQLAAHHRVVLFDRPGYGYSERPQTQRWTPDQQAELLVDAFAQLGIERPIVLGHSWGALVALSMGLHHAERIGGLVLGSGYYYPSLRVDVSILSAPALPVLGTLMRHTVSPLLGRLMWPLALRRMFAPDRPTADFERRYPVWMSLRPSQLRASASESAQMIPAATAMRPLYSSLKVPTVLVAGADDRLLSTRWHSSHLHEEIADSWLRIVEDAGHMVHHVATGQVVAAVEQVVNLRQAKSESASTVTDPVPIPAPIQ